MPTQLKLETYSDSENDTVAQVWHSSIIDILPLLTMIFREFL